jgi:hypothetical protein
MRSFGSSRWKKVRAEEERTEHNEDKNQWKTADVKDEDSLRSSGSSRWNVEEGKNKGEN